MAFTPSTYCLGLNFFAIENMPQITVKLHIVDKAMRVGRLSWQSYRIIGKIATRLVFLPRDAKRGVGQVRVSVTSVRCVKTDTTVMKLSTERLAFSRMNNRRM